MQERFKGQAGTGSRGRDQPKSNTNQKNRAPKRKATPPANLTQPSARAKNNQGRNQKQWAAEKRMASRY